MMKRDPRHIHALMTSWLSGHLTREEALQLKQLIAEDPAVKAAWAAFKEKFPPEDIRNAFQRYEERDWIPAEEITGHAPSRSHIYKIFKRAGWAAAIVIGIGVGWYLLGKNNIQKGPQPLAGTVNHQPGNKKDVSLQLASGQTINLSGSTDSIELADAHLKNAGKALSYTLATAGKTASGTSSMNTLRVPTGRDYRVTLSDGTELWLNSATTLQFPFKFTGNTREISINGEAYLKVAQQAGRPFLVHTRHGTIHVLGTAFNINDYDAATVKVALVEGAVRFTAGEEDVTLKPGREAVYTVNKGIRLQSFDEDEVLSWRSGKYYFSEATLDEIITVLPRWYGITVKIDNPTLSRERFAGVMDRNKPVQEFLDNLSKTMKISYYFDKENILHLQ